MSTKPDRPERGPEQSFTPPALINQSQALFERIFTPDTRPEVPKGGMEGNAFFQKIAMEGLGPHIARFRETLNAADISQNVRKGYEELLRLACAVNTLRIIISSAESHVKPGGELPYTMAGEAMRILEESGTYAKGPQLEFQQLKELFITSDFIDQKAQEEWDTHMHVITQGLRYKQSMLQRIADCVTKGPLQSRAEEKMRELVEAESKEYGLR